MSLGKVTVWHMTEEERLAYIAKHPIIPTEKPSGTTFENVYKMQSAKSKERNPQKKLIDDVDKEDLHRRFIAGETLKNIAKSLFISVATLENYIKEQRKIDSKKWPYRLKK